VNTSVNSAGETSSNNKAPSDENSSVTSKSSVSTDKKYVTIQEKREFFLTSDIIDDSMPVHRITKGEKYSFYSVGDIVLKSDSFKSKTIIESLDDYKLFMDSLEVDTSSTNAIDISYLESMKSSMNNDYFNNGSLIVLEYQLGRNNDIIGGIASTNNGKLSIDFYYMKKDDKVVTDDAVTYIIFLQFPKTDIDKIADVSLDLKHLSEFTYEG
jgi:hypothetical protein